MKRATLACLVAGLAFAGAIATAQTTGIEETGDQAESDQAIGDEADDELDEDARSVTREPTYNKRDSAMLRALDKITGRSTDFEIKVDAPVVYGSLKIDLEVCYQTPPEEPPESVAFLKIETAEAIRMQSMTVPRLASEVDGVSETGIDAEALAEKERQQLGDNAGLPEELLFSGWMFASSPGLSALEHPVYDVWVISCTQRAPSN